MADFTLECFSESGNAYKAALMLELCGADWEPHRVAFFAGETRGEAYRDLNVMGEAPVLTHHLPGGERVLSQSGAILDYLSRLHEKFGAEDEDEHLEILRWTLWDNHKLTSYSATYRFLTHFMKKPADDPVAAFFHARARSAWGVLEKHLETRDFIVGGRATIADFSLCGYLFWPEQIGMEAKAHPHITAWLGRIAALPGFRTAEDMMPSGKNPQTASA